MIKINYFDERELLIRREIETQTSKNTEAKDTEMLPVIFFISILFLQS